MLEIAWQQLNTKLSAWPSKDIKSKQNVSRWLEECFLLSLNTWTWFLKSFQTSINGLYGSCISSLESRHGRHGINWHRWCHVHKFVKCSAIPTDFCRLEALLWFVYSSDKAMELSCRGEWCLPGKFWHKFIVLSNLAWNGLAENTWNPGNDWLGLHPFLESGVPFSSQGTQAYKTAGNQA